MQRWELRHFPCSNYSSACLPVHHPKSYSIKCLHHPNKMNFWILFSLESLSYIEELEWQSSLTCSHSSAMLFTTPCPNQSRVTIRNLEGQDEIIYPPHAFFSIRGRISVGLYACLGVDKLVKEKALNLPWNKLGKCKNIVNLRYKLWPIKIPKSSATSNNYTYRYVNFLIQVNFYLLQDECRRQALLEHFGESFDPSACRNGSSACDNCLKSSKWSGMHHIANL